MVNGAVNWNWLNCSGITQPLVAFTAVKPPSKYIRD